MVEFYTAKRALHNKWVYRLKEKGGGKKRYENGLVVNRFAQKKGIDFDEIFSLVVKMTSIRCKNGLYPWGFGGRDLYAAATGVRGQRRIWFAG